VTGHDPSPGHAGGRVTPDRGFPPYLPHIRTRVPRDRGRCLATPPLGQGEAQPCDSLSSCPWGLAPRRHTAWDRRVHRAGEASGQSHNTVTASCDRGVWHSWRHPRRHREDDAVGRDRVLPASRVVRVPHPGVGRPYPPRFPASRGGMASSAALNAPAAMAVDREAEGAGAVLGPEEDIDDDVLVILLSASWPTPAVVDDNYGRYPCTPLGGSIVEQRLDAVDSRRMKSIWTTIRGMYDSLYAVPEGTVTDFPFLRSRKDWRVCQVLRHLDICEIPPEVGDKPHFSWEFYPGSPNKLGREPGRHGRTCRAYPLGGSSVTTPSLGGPPGPPLDPLSLFTWEGSAELGTPRAVNPAVWSSLGRSLGELPSTFNNGVDHTLIMALSRTLVRLRNEIAAIVSRPLGQRDVEPLYHLGTAETLRRLLTEEYGTAEADDSTVVAGRSLRNLAGSSAPPRGAALPAAPRHAPSPSPPHYGAGAVSSSQALYGAETGPSENPPTHSGSHYYAPEENRGQD